MQSVLSTYPNTIASNLHSSVAQRVVLLRRRKPKQKKKKERGRERRCNVLYQPSLSKLFFFFSTVNVQLYRSVLLFFPPFSSSSPSFIARCSLAPSFSLSVSRTCWFAFLKGNDDDGKESSRRTREIPATPSCVTPGPPTTVRFLHKKKSETEEAQTIKRMHKETGVTIAGTQALLSERLGRRKSRQFDKDSLMISIKKRKEKKSNAMSTIQQHKLETR